MSFDTKQKSWAEVRCEFPALKRWTYLNTATYGQTPACAAEAVRRHLEHRDELACSDFLEWFDEADRIRADLGLLIGCEAVDIAFLPTASAALSLLLAGVSWRPGDRVITLGGEFPNNLYGPALLAGRPAARDVDFVAVEWSDLFGAITPRTRVIAVSIVNYASGFTPPLEELASTCERAGIALFVDGTQSVGALCMNVRSLRPAMMAVDAYKWMLTPNGAGFVYVRPDVREWLPPNVVGWRSHKGWREVDNLHHGRPELPAAAEKYEGGMLPFPPLFALGAVARMMLELRPERIEARVRALAEYTRTQLRSVGFRPLADFGPFHDSPVVAAEITGADASGLARVLRDAGVMVSARHGRLRVSPHFYNDESDVDRLAETVRKLR